MTLIVDHIQTTKGNTTKFPFASVAWDQNPLTLIKGQNISSITLATGDVYQANFRVPNEVGLYNAFGCLGQMPTDSSTGLWVVIRSAHTQGPAYRRHTNFCFVANLQTGSSSFITRENHIFFME